MQKGLRVSLCSTMNYGSSYKNVAVVELHFYNLFWHTSISSLLPMATILNLYKFLTCANIIYLFIWPDIIALLLLREVK